MMISAPDNDVVLNIYELVPPSDEQQGNSMLRFFGNVLRSSGMGTYHTSISIRNHCYTFGSVSGIIKTTTMRERSSIPEGASYQESINLGPCTLDTQGEINEIVNNLRTFFTGTSYHLANRNCNHFTETFASALLMGDRLISEKPCSIDKYPKWVNRLAKTGTSLGVNDGNVCDVWMEARTATGADKKVSNELSSTHKPNKNTSKKSSSKKKQLTEKQKAALAKLKKSTK